MTPGGRVGSRFISLAVFSVFLGTSAHANPESCLGAPDKGIWSDLDTQVQQRVFDHHDDGHLILDDEHLAACSAATGSHQRAARPDDCSSPTSGVNGGSMVQTTPLSAKVRSTFAPHS